MKAPVLKTGIPQGIGGSNPSPSAICSEGGSRPPSGAARQSRPFASLGASGAASPPKRVGRAKPVLELTVV